MASLPRAAAEGGGELLVDSLHSAHRRPTWSMMRHRIHILCLLVFALTGCTRLEAIAPDVDPLADVHAPSIGDWSPHYETIDGLTRFARTDGERLIVPSGEV